MKREEVNTIIFRYIFGYYNTQRINSFNADGFPEASRQPQTVGNDYLISDGLNKYSVPFDLIGERVQIRLTKDLVEVYIKGSRMTSHKRLEKYSVQPVVKSEHTVDEVPIWDFTNIQSGYAQEKCKCDICAIKKFVETLDKRTKV